MLFTIFKYIFFLILFLRYRIELKNFFRYSVKNDIFAAAFADVYYSLNDYDSILKILMKISAYPLSVIKVIKRKKKKRTLLKSIVFTCINYFIFSKIFAIVFGLFNKIFYKGTNDFVLESVNLPNIEALEEKNYWKKFSAYDKKRLLRHQDNVTRTRSLYDTALKNFSDIMPKKNADGSDYEWWKDPKGIADMTRIDRYPYIKKYFDELAARSRYMRENGLSFHTIDYLDENGQDKATVILVREPGRSPKLRDVVPNKNPMKPRNAVPEIPGLSKFPPEPNRNLPFKHPKILENEDYFALTSYLANYKKKIEESRKNSCTLDDLIIPVQGGKKTIWDFEEAVHNCAGKQDLTYKTVKSTKQDLNYKNTRSTKHLFEETKEPVKIVNAANNENERIALNKIKSEVFNKNEQNLKNKEQDLNKAESLNKEEVNSTSTNKKQSSSKSSQKSKKTKNKVKNNEKANNKNVTDKSSKETKKHVKKTKERVNSNIDKYGVCTPDGGQDVINLNDKYTYNPYKGSVSKEYFERRAMKTKELRDKYVIKPNKNNNDDKNNNNDNNNNDNNNNNYIYVKSDTENKSKQRQKKW